MAYSVKEIFYTLQGEGARAGRPAVFCRFAGCNLWTGREVDRARAVCRFCDTDFVGMDGENGGRFATPEALVDAVAAQWPAHAWPAHAWPAHAWPQAGSRIVPYVVCTGGEPLLQLDAPLVEAFHARGFEIAVETNGTVAAPPGLDWICVSPKADTELVLTSGHELKLVYPQVEAPPERFEALDFEHFYLQPMDGPERAENTRRAIETCRARPQWSLSLQTHKLLGIP